MHGFLPDAHDFLPDAHDFLPRQNQDGKKGDDEFINKPLSYYDILGIIFGKSVAMRQFVRTSQEQFSGDVCDNSQKDGMTPNESGTSSGNKPSERAKKDDNVVDDLVGAIDRGTETLASLVEVIKEVVAAKTMPNGLFEEVDNLTAHFSPKHGSSRRLTGCHAAVIRGGAQWRFLLSLPPSSCTLGEETILFRLYGTVLAIDAEPTARSIEAEAFDAAAINGVVADSMEDGIKALQLYSKEVSLRRLDFIKSFSAATKAASTSEEALAATSEGEAP
ncbi:hypothetical protein GUJ93_ZPchr0012g19486 [Zizania palustris]|uniref:WPP domain-containing protein n=1 Tax=Zizania palustris TaxID=103762 RepID=A0A8J5WV85_ZIZPA|nr:hypothetical protein GUJ93_ZPchr0012g19486 [Zizania palustris]